MRLSDAIKAYVENKCSAGISFAHGSYHLSSLCKHVGDPPLCQVSSRDVQSFLDLHPEAGVLWRTRYFLLLRFFEFWSFRGAMPRLLLPPPRARVRRTFTPHIYTKTEICSLLKAIPRCQKHNLCIVAPETFRGVILTLYATGALIGEVLDLRITNVNFQKRRITFPGNRVMQCRTIPICDDLKQELQSSGSMQRGQPGRSHFFLTKTGQAIRPDTLQHSFRQLRRMAGVLRRDGELRQPRMRDLRSTFAVHRITSWIKQGVDLNRFLPALAAYMGNVSLESTESYLSLTPERFRKELNKLSPQRGRKRWRDDPALMKFLASL